MEKKLETNQKHQEFESEGLDSNNAHLTNKETRQVVTPYAFYVSDDLLGTPLARPFRRGFSILIDLFFISLLTQVSSLILATVAAWTFFKAGNRLKTKKRFNSARVFLRLLVALLVFVVAIGVVDEINEDDSIDAYSPNISVGNGDIVGGIEVVALTAKYLLKTKALKEQVIREECKPAFDCFKRLGENLIKDVVSMNLDKNSIAGVLEGYIGGISETINADEKQKLEGYLSQYAENHHEVNSTDKFESEEVEGSIAKQTTVESKSNVSKGIVEWVKNLAEDLGLGFGWAALYFSIFTAWWKGQTPGKKILGIKVIKLDNQPLSLWESFGRYGGYAAGLATGLMGFLQVFWDPNRQAIQDKISETLVIDLRKPKIPFVKDTVE